MHPRLLRQGRADFVPSPSRDTAGWRVLGLTAEGQEHHPSPESDRSASKWACMVSSTAEGLAQSCLSCCAAAPGEDGCPGGWLRVLAVHLATLSSAHQEGRACATGTQPLPAQATLCSASLLPRKTPLWGSPRPAAATSGCRVRTAQRGSRRGGRRGGSAVPLWPLSATGSDLTVSQQGWGGGSAHLPRKLRQLLVSQLSL